MKTPLPDSRKEDGLGQRLAVLASGGRWSLQLPTAMRTSLRWFLADGIFANASGSILGTYQSLYLLALGASRGDIGMLESLISLMLPLAMAPGAWLARHTHSYRRLIVTVSLVARLLLVGVIIAPWLFPATWLAPLGMGLLILYAFCMNLLSPAWTAMVGEIVPAQWRGRYFSFRNIWMGLSGFIIVLGIGWLVDRLGKPQGYQGAFGVALLLGLVSTYAFSRIHESAPPPAPASGGAQGGFWRGLAQQPLFLMLCLIGALWNFGLLISGPFFNIYLVEVTGASAAAVGVSSAVFSLAALPGQRIFGSITDRVGSRRIQALTGLVIPLVPLLWGFMTRVWHAYPVQILSGFIWAGYNLASFNLLLELTPTEGRTSYVAFYQALAGLGMALGAAVGGWVVQQYGYRAVFLTSAAVRWAAALWFMWSIARSSVKAKVENTTGA